MRRCSIVDLNQSGIIQKRTNSALVHNQIIAQVENTSQLVSALENMETRFSSPSL